MICHHQHDLVRRIHLQILAQALYAVYPDHVLVRL